MNNGDQKSASDPEGPASRTRYVVLLGLCLAAAIAYLPRSSLGVAESTIRGQLQLSDTQMGWVMAAFALTYAAFQLPTGWLSQEWGSRRALPIFCILWSAISGLMALAGGFPSLFLNRLGLGAAQAGAFPAATLAIARWFPVTQRSLASGALGSSMSIGGALAAWLTGELLGPLGWRGVCALYAAPGLVWAVWFFLWFRDRPEEHASVSPSELARIDPRGAAPRNAVAAVPHEGTPWLALLSSPAMWWISGQQFFRAAGYMFYLTWFATYLQEAWKVTVKDSGFLNSLPLWGVVLGGVAGGAFSDWVLVRTGSRRLSRQGLAAAGLFVSGLLIFLAYRMTDVWGAVLFISLGAVLAAAAGACAYTITIDMGGKHVATVFSTMNMAGNVGGMLFPLLIPYLVRWTGGWQPVLIVFAAIHFAAAACWALLKPEGTVFDQSLIPAPRS